MVSHTPGLHPPRGKGARALYNSRHISGFVYGSMPDEFRTTRTYSEVDAYRDRDQIRPNLAEEVKQQFKTGIREADVLRLGPKTDYLHFCNEDSYADSPHEGRVNPDLLKFHGHRELADEVRALGYFPAIIMKTDGWVYLVAVRASEREEESDIREYHSEAA